ncbi:RTEL1, partial [Symbiodinium sp. KB8]
MKAFFLKLEEEIDKIGTEKSSLKNAERFGAGDVQGWTLPGPALYQLLEAAQLSSKYVQQMLDMLEHISTFLREVRLGAAPESLRLEKFGKILERLFYKTGSEAIIQGPGFATSSVEWKPRFMDVSSGKSFYLVVHSGRRSGKPQRRSAFLSHDSSNRGKDLSFWCFSPGVALQQLVELEVGSIIFTSGTLSPMKSFEAEFGLKFNVKFSNSHVVADDQVCLMALNKGPSGVALNSRYQNRTSPEYMREIGMLVANAARVVPDGLLVFFPSFSVLRSTIAFWQKDQEGVLWKRITGSKVPLTEPQNTVEAREVMQMFRESVDAGRGAVLFAVCRGRVSEGLDFNNRYGRAVIVTGIPYPPQYDPKIVLKQRYLANVKTGVSGAEWYQFQAFRAVNQAIGRVLRHAKDYGAILLCDERFSTSTNMLSTWLQPYLKTLSNYGQVVYNLGRFYQHCRTTYPVVEAASALPSEETKEEQGK